MGEHGAAGQLMQHLGPRRAHPRALAGGEKNLPPPISEAELDLAITKRGLVTFSSWQGRRIGADCDSEITFLPNHCAHMTEYGYAQDDYSGVYSFGSDGQITLACDGYGHPWPHLVLERDTDSLLLHPADADTGFVMGNRGGATLSGGLGSFWPFRPVSSEEQEVIRERLADWNARKRNPTSTQSNPEPG